MTSPLFRRRAALLFVAFGAAGCDVVDFASDPMPRFEQTWNLPAPATNVSVASILPPGDSVTIVPDSSAFAVIVSSTSFSRRVGADCAQCEAQNGTNAFKPAFVLVAGSSTPLPTGVLTAAVIGGSMSVRLTNNMSFDPLFVRNSPPTQTQGHMVIVIRSGSLVLGRDSVNGATTTFAPGTQMTRLVPLSTGTITGSITVDVTVTSPAGDHNEFLNANGTLNGLATVPSLNVASVSMNVQGRPLTSVTDTVDLAGLGGVGDNVVRGALEMAISNPFAVTGSIGMRFAYGAGPSDAISKTVAFPAGGTLIQRISLDSAEMALLMGNEVAISTTGTVTASSPITVTPRQAISIGNRMILTVRTGRGN